MTAISGNERCRLEDMQARHIAALDALACAIDRMRRIARTEEDARILRELYTARSEVRAAWRIVCIMHPQGASHD